MLQWPTDKMAELDGSYIRTLAPEQMVAEVNAFHRIKAISLEDIEEEEGDQDWIAWDDYGFPSCLEMAKFVEENDFDDDDVWADWLAAKLGEKSINALDSLTERQCDRLFAFFNDPHKSPLPARHPIRKVFPDIVDAVERQRIVRKIQRAKACISVQKEPYIYWGVMIPTPEFEPQFRPPALRIPKDVTFKDRYPGRFQGQQEVWCYFDPCYDGEMGSETDQFCYRYSAVWVDVNTQGFGKLVASATGYYIPLWGGEHSIDEECFREVCFDNNGLLPSLPKVVIEQFLPSEGLPTFQQFQDLCYDFGIGFPGFALVCVDTLGDKGRTFWYEHDILEDFFFNLSRVLDDGFTQCYTNPKMHRPPYPDEDEATEIDEEDDSFEHPGPGQAPIRLFVVPITSEPVTDIEKELESDPEWAAGRAYKRARRFRDSDKNAENGFFVRTMFLEDFDD